jgi:hypothetical protein
MIKKLLFLLVPLFVFTQTSGDGADISLEYIGTTVDSSKPLSKVQVNDTIVVAIDISNLDDQHKITYAHIDVEYNTAAFARIGDPTWKTPTGAQNSIFAWNNIRWTRNDQYDDNDLWAQWSQSGGSYGAANGWNVDHWQAISTTEFGDDTYGHFVELKFKVKDAGSAHDYTENIFITMARIADNSGASEYVYPVGEVRAHPTQAISHTPLEDLDSNLSINVDTNSNVDPTKLKVIIKEDGTQVASLPLDSNGDVTITDYVISSAKTYTAELAYNGSGDDNYVTDWLDNAFTVSDVAYLLTETEGGAGHGNPGAVISNGISALHGDLADPTRQLTPQDAYKMLVHVLGDDIFSEDHFTKSFRAARKADFDAFTMNHFVNDSIFYYQLVDTIVPNWSATNNKFEYKTGILGDVNLNYSSAQPESTTSNPSPNPTVTRQTSTESKTGVGTAKVAVTSKIEEDKFIVELTLGSEELIASQFKLIFDQTRLTFDEVNFDTGNNTTNFAYAGDKLINFGSINQQKAAIKKDSKYILTFTKGASVDSPAGLFSIRNFDAANLKGELIILDFE